jgi:hypothetical protein
MKAVRTVADKEEVLKQRLEGQRTLGRHIDKILSDGKHLQEGEEIGCGGRSICHSMGRGVARMLGIHSRSTVSTREIEVATESVSAQGRVKAQMTSRLFGVAVAKKTPEVKLAQASEAMRKRVELLESRAAEARSNAANSMTGGNKAAAMRELKKSKVLEKQAASTQSALDALEAQSVMLEQTALQKEVAAALGATAKSLKKEKNLLSKAEEAVDAASEMRDLHEDLSAVMAGLGDNASNEYDDDELMSELESMMVTDPAPEAPVSDKKAERARLKEELQRAEMDHLEHLRQNLPSAPTGAVRETESLLGQA